MLAVTRGTYLRADECEINRRDGGTTSICTIGNVLRTPMTMRVSDVLDARDSEFSPQMDPTTKINVSVASLERPHFTLP